MTRAPRAVPVATALAVALLAGCSAVGSPSSDRTWVPKPEGPPPAELPQPEPPDQATPPDDPGGPGRGGPAPGEPGDPNVVATRLRLPWGLALLPDGSALVGERTTGRIVRVLPERAPVRTVRRLPGIDASGDGGLLDLAVSPRYQDDRLVFAYVTTRTDNRIVRFTVRGQVTPVLTGIPRGRTGNGGRLAFGPDGMLYVGTGDTGRPALAANPRSLAGKVLRVTTFGRPAAGNPSRSSPVLSRGHRNVAGLCLGGRGRVYTAEPAQRGRPDELNLVEPGRHYGWPTRSRATEEPTRTVPAGTAPLGGCAVLERGLFVTALRGQRLLALPLDDGGVPGRPTSLLAGTYGRLRTVVAAPDGALWLTTSNRDGAGRPGRDDDRVIRILPPTSTTNSPA